MEYPASLPSPARLSHRPHSPRVAFRLGLNQLQSHLTPIRIGSSCFRFVPPPLLQNRFGSSCFPQDRIGLSCFPQNRIQSSCFRHRSSGSSPICCAQAAAGMKESGKLGERGELKIFESVDELSTSLADYVAELSDAAVKERGAFSVALSGGSLISQLGKLCEPPYLKTVDWSRWHVFWVDERVVPRNHPDSNYKLAKDGLLSKVPILPGQVYSINDALSAEAAADDYEFGLRQLVKTKIVDVSTSSDCPRFDLILLGMGPDGHVASLFPGHPLTHEKEKWITFITDSPKPPPERITFTFPVINFAANVVMVVAGANKAEALEKAFGEELPPGVLPVQMVSPVDGKLVWFLDKDASSKLPGLDQLK